MIEMLPLDIEDFGALANYLAGRGLVAGGVSPSFEKLAGGVSNKTVLVSFPNGPALVLKQALPKLRVAVDWFSDPERAHREAVALDWYGRLAPPGAVPKLVFENREHHLLAMDAVPRPHKNWKSALLSGELHRNHFEQFGNLLGVVHAQASANAELRQTFADTSFFESLRLEPYYLYSASQVPEAAEFLHRLVAETRSRRVTLVHGDYSPKNILVHEGRLVLLDYEVAHFGDPAFDVGFSLTHFCSKAHHLPDRRSDFAEAACVYWRRYCAAAGVVGSSAQNTGWTCDLEARVVRHTLGCLLARVAGRSPLEYLSAEERARQRAAVISLISAIPASVPGLISEFLARLES